VISSASNVDDQWMKYLEDPPEEALKRYSELSERADVLVRENISSFVLEGREVDVVISGGANYDAYYLGVAQVFSRVNLTQVRFAGASAGTTISLSLSLSLSLSHTHTHSHTGGMAPFELTLKGEKETLVEHLSYGILQEEYPKDFWTDLADMSLQDHHWRKMAHVMFFSLFLSLYLFHTHTHTHTNSGWLRNTTLRYTSLMEKCSLR